MPMLCPLVKSDVIGGMSYTHIYTHIHVHTHKHKYIIQYTYIHPDAHTIHIHTNTLTYVQCPYAQTQKHTQTHIHNT